MMAFRSVQKVLKVSGLSWRDPSAQALFQLDLHFLCITTTYVGSCVRGVMEGTWKHYIACNLS